MKMVKSLLLGSAAGIAAVAGAQAADLPVKAKPVEYVKVCSLYGAGYYYIPGTQTCIRIGGFLRMNVGINNMAQNTPNYTGAAALRSRDRPFINNSTRVASQIDVRSNTDYGVLRTYVYTYFNVGSQVSASPTILTAYTQLAGFTVGKFKSSFYAPWSTGGGPSLAMYRPDDASSSAGIEYKWDLGGGLSAALGVFDPRRTGVFDRLDTMSVTGFANSQPALGVQNSGYHMPDINANVRVEQAWGGIHIGARAHEVMVTYNGATEPTGAPKTKYGWAVNASLNLKNLPTGPGDQLWATVGYNKGAMNSMYSSTPGTSFALFGPGRGAAYNTVAFGNLLEGVFDSSGLLNGGALGGGEIQLTEGFSATLAYEHWWLPAKLKSTLYGNYATVRFNDTAKAIICTTGAGASRFGFNPGSVCDPNWSYTTIGSASYWYPARDFEIMVDVGYSRFDTASSGTMTGAGVMPSTKPTGAGFNYEVKDQGILYGTVQFLRTW